MKRGISLIAVLMFMLAATTASIVLFRMLGSENFSSGARLKASEAYQASESGIDAVHSWLANRGVEAGELVTQYVEAKKPMKINLGSMVGDKQQNFEAYLIGAEVTGKNQPVRLKVLVEGKARDGSVVTQTAILKVSGLYKTTITPYSNIEPEPEPDPDPVQVDQCTPKPNPDPPTCTADPPPPPTAKKCALPDLWGNMQTVGFVEARTMIITQTMSGCNAGGQALNSIKIGTAKEPGYLILDGNFYANNGIYIYGDLYSNGTFNMCASGSDFITGDVYFKEFHPRVSTGTLTIGGSAYLDGPVTPNVPSFTACGGGATQFGCSGQLGGVVNIKGNTTIMGPYSAFTGDGGGGNLDFKMEGNLVMGGNNSYIDLGTSNVSSSKFEVTKNASVVKLSNAKPSITNKTSPLWPKFNGSLCLGTTSVADGSDGGYNVYKDPRDFYFKIKTAPSPSCNVDGADPLDGSKTPSKNLKAELSTSATKTCNMPPVKFDMDIYNNVKTTTQKWAHRDNQPGGCASGSGQMNLSKPWSTLLTELNTCWKSKKSDEIYKKDPSDKNEWIVIYIKNNYQFQRVDGNLGDGKYIIIFDFENGKPKYDPNNPYNIEFLYLPPTGPKSTVMLYFPRGFDGRIELDGQETGKIPQQSEYNYFIFSDGDIREFNTTAYRTLHGNVFMNDCAKINLPGATTTPYFYSKGNDAFVDQLMESNILSATEHCKNTSGGDNPVKPTYTLKCTPPPTTGFVGEAIQQPRVTCEGSNNTSKLCGFDWVDAPSWNCLKDEKTYNVKVKANANSGNCQNSPQVDCGPLTVSKPENTTVTCRLSKTNGNVGEKISEPATVKCGDNKLTGGFIFTGDVPNWDKLEENIYNVGVKVTSGICNNGIAQCGTLTVKDPSKNISLDDKPWIPISNRLSVKVESKEISKQKVPTGIKDLEKSILVMPRMVRIPSIPSDISNARDYISKRYSYMYMNGAKKGDEAGASQLECKNTLDPNENLFGGTPKPAIYLCNFTGTLKAKHSPFYVNLGGVAVGGGPGGYNEGEQGEAECILATTKYTHGQNIQVASIRCEGGGSATNVVFDAIFGPPLTKDASGNYYYSGPEASDNAIISASGKCGSKDVEGLCYAVVNGGRNYTLEITKPTCFLDPGPWSSECPQTDPYNCSGSNCCKSKPELPAPTHDCGTASKDATPPQFNYSAENDGAITGNRDNIGWNKNPPQTHNFNTIGLNRVARMFEISCGGHRLYYGTINGKEGIVCDPGYFNIIKEGTSGTQPDLPACQANVRCSTNNYCNSNTSVPPPTITCVTGGSYSGPIFRYTEDKDPSKLSGTTLSNWNKGSNQTVSSTRDVYLLQVNCNGTPYVCGTGGPTSKGLFCGSVEIKKDCASNVTATCKLVNKSDAEVTNLTVTQGENVKAPKITCSNGEASWPYFSTSGSGLPTGSTNWSNGSGDAYYTNAHEPGDYAISVSSVNCGATTLSNIPCGTITVQKPTCSISGTYTYVNSSTPNVPPPTYSCGNATKTTGDNVLEFKYTAANNGDVSSTATTNWNKYPSSDKIMISERANANVYMYKVTCDGNTLTYGTNNISRDGILCGTFSVVRSSSGAASSSSVAASSSSARSSSSVASSSSVRSSSSGGGGGTCGSGNATSISNPPSVGNCLNLTQGCTKDNNLPLKVYNDGSYSSSNIYSGTIYCSDGSSKSISCTPQVSLCESNACPAGTTGAWLYITSVSGSPQVRANCY
ncbi:MAG: hypothetical protein FWF63_01895 [Fibromonadales bacterium]|nr:hypothetical protein [Fibromonadales bacterium]